MNFKSIRYYLLSTFLAFSLASCDDSYKSSIPDYFVSLQLNLTTTYPTFKNSSNQFLLFETRVFETDRIGFGGILVCSGVGFDDSGNTRYYAYDMACPYEVKNNIKVYPVENDLGKVACEKCGSVYDVGFGFGNPVSGPAKESLKRYRASLSGDVLYISR
ncbi:MAG: hypothetical protein GZ091_14515 [Paludibacter sp.]|nr:hypothetical protein [Paludibacter sp.]